MRDAAELLGLALIVIGLAFVWLPLGLVAAGGTLVVAAHLARPPVAPPEPSALASAARRAAR